MHRLSLSFHLLERSSPPKYFAFSYLVFSWFFLPPFCSPLFLSFPSKSIVLPICAFSLHRSPFYTFLSYSSHCSLFFRFRSLCFLLSLLYLSSFIWRQAHQSTFSLFHLVIRCSRRARSRVSDYDLTTTDSNFNRQVAKSRFCGRCKGLDERRGILCTITRVQQRVRNG